MSQRFKGKRPNQISNASPGLSGLDLATAPAKVREQLAGGKSNAALTLAKDLFKAQPSPENEALLIEAYVARVEALLQQGLVIEAKSLTELVRQRHPAAGSALDSLGLIALARGGSIDELLRPLNTPDISPERRAAIEAVIQQHIYDPALIAKSTALPPDHPLRAGAQAIKDAFGAVTRGKVEDDRLALSEISRRSALAPWKLLVRAIAAFYRNDDAVCRQSLEGIRPETAAARLVPAIRALLGDKPEPSLTPAGSHLVSSVTGQSTTIAALLERLDRAFAEDDEDDTLEAVKKAIAEVRRALPDRLEEFKQRVVVRCMMDGFEPREVSPLLGGPVHPGPELQRLLATGMEMVGHPASTAVACASWHDFRLSAVEEGWFKNDGQEVAAIYLHIAELLVKLEPEQLRELQRKGTGEEDEYFLRPEKLFQRACLLDPHTEAFSKWLNWASGRPRALAVEAAEAWNKLLPDNIEPVLFLMDDLAKRDKYPSALKYLAQAERIDAVNPRVRKARLRLTTGNAIRLIQQKNYRKTREAIDEIAALPQTQQGDRPIFIEALRYMAETASGHQEEASRHEVEVARMLGAGFAAGLLIDMLGTVCKRVLPRPLLKPDKIPAPQRGQLPKLVARVMALMADMETKAELSRQWVAATSRQFAKAAATLEIGELKVLGETALSANNFEFAYNISTVGLWRPGAEAAFLLLRARSIPGIQVRRHLACAAAAAQMARQQRNMEIVDQAVTMLQHTGTRDDLSLNSFQAAEVVAKEKSEKKFPKPNERGPNYDSLIPDWGLCQCPACRGARGEGFGVFEDKDDWDDGDDDDFDDEEILDEFPPVPPGMPPAIAKMLFTEILEALESGESQESFLDRMGLLPGPKKGKGKRK